MSNISLVMNTLNEEENIRAVINCFESVINEVVIVDCNSTDNTRELARKLGARVYNIGQCPGYGEMRSISVHLAKTDWAIVIDGDERMDEVDVQKIPELIKLDIDLVWLPRQHYRAWDRSICENPDLSVYADWQARMVRVMPHIRWVRKVHEQLRGIEKGRELKELSNPVIKHFGFMKSKERLDSIKELCDRLWKEDEENKDSYILENLLGTTTGNKYWENAPEYHKQKEDIDASSIS